MADPAAATRVLFDTSLSRTVGDGPLGVAVSGGGDSLALLDLAAEWAARDGRQLCAATVDHGLRTESADEATFVAAFCAARRISHETLTIEDLAGRPGNLSAHARAARYGALSAWASRHGCAQVLLGHTMDDQAETVLMRLARGSGVEGLSGMAESSERLGLRWLRPLLGVRRAALRDWLRARGIAWIDDPTNDDAAYDRVKARAALSALDPLGVTVDGLAATADRLRRQRHVLEAAADDLTRAAVTWTGEDTARLDRAALRAALPDTAMRVLAETLRRIGGVEYRPRFRALGPLYDRAVSTERFTATLARCLIRTGPGGETLLIAPETAAKRGV